MRLQQLQKPCTRLDGLYGPPCRKTTRMALLIYFSFILIFLNQTTDIDMGHIHTSIHKDYKLVYIFHTTTTTTEISYPGRRTGRTTCTSPRTRGLSDLVPHHPCTQGRSLGPTRSASATSHLCVVQMGLEHPFHPIKLRRLHRDNGCQRPVADC